jgi:ATP-binding cassette subfamily C protein
VDLILGVISPQQGELSIFGLEPKKIQSLEPGKIAYVPQSVYLTSGSILENVGLGIDRANIDPGRVLSALEKVHLDLWVNSLSQGIHSTVGERGSRLSGGQKQRLGIARALYQDPLLLVLDEATSSLDAESEHEISASIESLKRKITTIIIAHRLSTVIKCDQVAYLNDGELVSQGTFTELRKAVPDFDRQANLMGITG